MTAKDLSKMACPSLRTLCPKWNEALVTISDNAYHYNKAVRSMDTNINKLAERPCRRSSVYES
jgi:hypothetical protein